MINKIMLSFILVFPLFVYAVSESGYFSPDIEKWDRPRPIFSPMEVTNKLIQVEKIDLNSLSEIKEETVYADSGVYFFANMIKPMDHLLVFNDKEYGLKIWFEGYSHRPIGARWINAKLLFIEMYVNPHFGAYWIYDVENEKVILGELQNDGWQAYVQVHGFPEDNSGTTPLDKKQEE